MDLAQDILRIVEKVAQVPGLSAACSLTMTIIKTVQISKNNTARLQYLAHSVADNLVTIAEHMTGKWDTATDNLKHQLDCFDGVLRDIAKLVTKYAKSSPVMAFINAGDRDMDIQRLERRLADTQTSLLLLLGVDTSLSLQNLETGIERLTFGVESHLQSIGSGVDNVQVSLGQRVEDTYSTVLYLKDVIQGNTALASYPRVVVCL